MPWSYSQLETYEACPAKYRYRYVDRLPEPKSPALERGLAVHAEAEAYLRGAEAAPGGEAFGWRFAELRSLGAEPETSWGWGRDWGPVDWSDRTGALWGRGRVDAYVRYADRPDVADVVDFKTGRSRSEHWKQIELYALVAMARDPGVERVAGHLWYLDEGGVRSREFERDKIDAQEWADRAGEMEADKSHPPRPGAACRWCAFARSKGGPCRYG